MSHTPTQGTSAFEQKLNKMFGTAVASIIFFGLQVLEVLVISLAIILPVRYFLVQPFYVQGASMEPTFLDHEYLVIDELTYRFRAPERGEVVVFRYPGDPSQYFIKRVIGLPGETVKVHGGKVEITPADGGATFVLREAYLGETPTTLVADEAMSEDEYFVMGDNRPKSLDSRVFGAIHKSAIVGRVWVRAWPVTRASVFAPPVYPQP